MNTPLAVLTTYFDLVNSFSVDTVAYAAVLHPEVVQTEYPNGLYKTIQQRSFTEIIDNLRIARELLRDPQFAVHSSQECADGSVVVEGLWQATAVSEAGPLSRGQRLSAQLCLVFEFKDGKIFRQRRYPCFDAL